MNRRCSAGCGSRCRTSGEKRRTPDTEAQRHGGIMKIKLGIVAAIVALAIAPVTGQNQRKIEILFLGHNSQHHNSNKFAPLLKEALAAEPFNFTYTTDLNDLNEANLAKYDELIIYANHN